MGDFGAKDQINGHGVSLVFIPHPPPGASRRPAKEIRTIDAAPHHVKALEASTLAADASAEMLEEDVRDDYLDLVEGVESQGTLS
jgi:hypothetical protein